MTYDCSQIDKQYRDAAFYYALSVVNGERLASKKVYKACMRHLADLQKITDDDFLYDYHPDKGADPINFIEILPDVKTGKPYPLAEFQKFILANLYGWRYKSNDSIRRFKKAMISLARKNGKTIIVAGIALYEFLFGKNPAMSRQIFFTANDRAQANIAREMARKQLEALRSQSDEIRKATKIVRDEMRNLNDESYMRALSRDTGAVDGFEPYLGILDEFAASKTNEMIELLVSGQGQLDNPLILIISTAGMDLNAPMHTVEYPYIEKILDRKIEDDSYFAFIAEQDNEEEIKDEANWIKSNPILEVEALHDKLIDYLRKRRQTSLETGQVNEVLIKNFNMWRQSSEESYIDKQSWELARIDKPDTNKRRVWLGVDVGRVSDLFAITPVVMMDDFWYIDSFSFVATKYGLTAKEKRDGVSYSNLERQGYCEITTLESGVIDDERVLEKIEEMVYTNEWEVNGICFDPYQFGTLLTMIEKRHPEWPLIEVSQTTMVLNMPTKQFRDDLKKGKIKHSGNPLLTMAVNNAYIKTDNNGMKIDKNKNSNKIDPLDAALDGYAVCYLEPFDGSGYWTSEKILGGETLF
ncbi:terminase large subunit [Streptococcus ictaluri]|uniref:Phage terminase, large subunit n=1 Tax=Streptococcus ictaluri 707-05 TaxID=764299 RepID=G5K0H6_9STRE|nr:terminase TerL endonuclease subunit [Streptococcus ictaluri]EHI70658.1 putative phage terminase, large subunit [Streptococcus ictaluri 707-05]